MKLLNLCCGSQRVLSDEWINVDQLHDTLLPGTPERENLDKEKNYFDCNVTGKSFDGTVLLPAEWAETFDGILASHCLEHWDCQDGVYVMKQCWSLLKPGGVLLVSVPDASYFRKVHTEDTVENAERLFGEPIHLPDGETTFFGYGLWNRWHKAVLTEDALWCYFRRAGFEKTLSLRDVKRNPDNSMSFDVVPHFTGTHDGIPILTMMNHLNRLPFSLVMCGVKEQP